ncbi:MAG: hypothetical protein EP334_07835 [Gammaproteobacteria bacterium]|nr:MAG: hypothetical protein EP334_07835 [Gammaproteobacteria bacterium]
MSIDPQITADTGCAERVAAEQGTIDKVVAVMVAELDKQGLSGLLQNPEVLLTSYELRRDPYDGSEGLHAEWRNGRGQRLGGLQLHGSGQVFAEFDVVQAHPTDSRWFIEAVSAWGNPDNLKSELRLLPSVGA